MHQLLFALAAAGAFCIALDATQERLSQGGPASHKASVIFIILVYLAGFLLAWLSFECRNL